MRWLGITSSAPISATAYEVLAAELAATMSQRRRWRAPRPRLALEVIRTGDGPTLAGIWVPGEGADLERVIHAVRQALPDAEITERADESIPRGGHLVGRELRPISGPWTVLTEPSAQRAARDRGTEEPLRLVLNAITGSTSWAGLQVVITPGAQQRPADPSEASSGYARAAGLARRVGRLLPRLARYTALSVIELMKFLAEIVTLPGLPPSTKSSRVTLSSLWGRDDGKRINSHVHVTVRVATTGDNPRHGSLPEDVAAAYRPALPLATLAPFRIWRDFAGAWTRRDRGRGFYVTVDELAALWHLP